MKKASHLFGLAGWKEGERNTNTGWETISNQIKEIWVFLKNVHELG